MANEKIAAGVAKILAAAKSIRSRYAAKKLTSILTADRKAIEQGLLDIGDADVPLILTRVNGVPAPTPNTSTDELNATFEGLSLVSEGGTDTKYYRFSGTDAVTGQVFDGSQPRMWGGALQWQVIGAGGFTADQHFTISFPTGVADLPGNGGCLRVVRNEDHVQPSQAALKFLPNTTWQNQGFALMGFRIRIPSGFPTTTNQQFTLMEVKSQGGDSPYSVVHLLLSREDIGGTDKWCMKLGAVSINGTNSYETWGSTTTQTATVTPAQDAYYDGKFYKVLGDGTLTTEGWYTFIFGFRLKDHAGNVSGNGSDGWVGVWYAPPNGDGTPKDWSDCTLQQLVTGRNLGYVTGPSADYVFVLNHYNANNGVTDLPWQYWRTRVTTNSWWADGPSRPAGAV
jgi:hypothetical protein